MQEADREEDHPAGPGPDLAVLWTKVQPTVAAFIRSMVPHHHDAQDLLQRTAAKTFRSIGSYDPARPFTAWVIAIARNEVRNHWRTRARDRHVFGDEHLELVAATFESLEAEASPMREALLVCLDGLGERSRRLLALKYEEHLDAAAIGGRLAMKANAVLVAIHRVRRALRDCVERRIALEAGT
jgi:RNA polymerase sigma-70 factor (ECF subfamily)